MENIDKSEFHDYMARFLENDLSEQEIDQLQVLLKNNQELLPEFRKYLQLGKVIEQQKLKIKYEIPLVSANRPIKKGYFNRSFYWLISVAASLLLLFGAWKFFYIDQKATSYKDLAAAYYQPFGSFRLDAMRGTTDSIETGVGLAKKLYRSGKYQDALIHFSGSWDGISDTQKQELALMKSNCHYLLGEKDIAIATLENAPTNGEHFEVVHWYLGLYYLEKGDKDRIKKEFQLLKGSVLEENAQKLLKEISSFNN